MDSMLATLRRIVQAVTAQARFANAVQTLVIDVKDAMQADVCTIYLINPARTHFVLAATDGLNLDKVGSAEIALADGLVGQVARRAEPLNLNDARGHPSFLYLADSGEEAVNSFLGVPIIHQGRTLGVLVVQQQDARRFDESEEAFLVTLAASHTPIPSLNANLL